MIDPKVAATVSSIRLKLSEAAPHQKFSVLKEEIGKLEPPEFKQEVGDLISIGWDAAMAQNNPTIAKYALIERIITLVLGALFIGALLYISNANPNPTPFQYVFWRITLALAAGLFTITLPGALSVKINAYLHGSGAFGVVLLVYFLNPVRLVVK